MLLFSISLLTLLSVAPFPPWGRAQLPLTTSTSFEAPQFTVPASADVGLPIIPNIQDPEAVDAQTLCPGYTASDVQDSGNGFTAVLHLAGNPCNAYGTDIANLKLSVEYQSSSRLAIHIEPAVLDSSNYSHYVLPETLIPRPSAEPYKNGVERTFNVTWSNTPSFAFSVQRISTNDTVFSTFGSKLVFEDQFIEFVTAMPDDYNVYGLGERIHGHRLGNNLTATTYAADTATPIDYNIYGSHPVYIDTRYFEQSADGKLSLLTGNGSNPDSSYTSYTHAVYHRNAHGQEVLLRSSNITFRLLGGSIDLFIIDGPTPPEAIQGYQYAATGYPAMQQYWSFGYHQCRWGYANWTQLQEVVDSFKRFDIPLETIWSDIDYMKGYRDFTTDPNAFPVPEGQEFLGRLHGSNQHYIPIIDAAIYIPNPQNASDAYSTYKRGNSSGVFLKNPDGSQYIGSVWPGYTVFPDWHSENAIPWWINEVNTWHQEIPFDGIWIDMNEVSSFCVGSCGTGNLTLNPVHPPFALPGEPGNINYDYPDGFNITNATEAASASSASAIQASSTASSASSASSSTSSYFRSTPTPGVRNVNHPPYAINNVNGDLAVHAVSPNATHSDGIQEYDVHNLYGYQILNATYQALLRVFPGRRPLIIGRSTFSGSGKWAGHWGGDNHSKWADIFFSIPQALSFSIFGIPMFGVDTCGFNGQSDEELCNRWMQLSAFFPFYRNHNVLASNPQEPYIWSSVIDATKKAMRIRYLLLPHLYTLFWSAHTRGTTVMRALAWEFPSEPSLRAADRQFLLGPALLVTPVLNQGATSVNGVFPGLKDGTRWYDWYSQTEVTDVKPGTNVSIPAPLGHIPLFVRGGYILPLQEPGYTTTESRNGKWALLVALDKNNEAQGEIYIDDGYSLEPNATRQVTISASRSSLGVKVVGTYDDSNPLANITVMGLSTSLGQVQLNGQTLGRGNVVYNATSKALSVTGLDSATSHGAWKSNWTLSWT